MRHEVAEGDDERSGTGAQNLRLQPVGGSGCERNRVDRGQEVRRAEPMAEADAALSGVVADREAVLDSGREARIVGSLFGSSRWCGTVQVPTAVHRLPNVVILCMAGDLCKVGGALA